MRPQNQSLLALIMALCMVAGFIGVYAIGWNYDQTKTPETVFVSDSDTEFTTVDLRPSYEYRGFTGVQAFNSLTSPMWYGHSSISPYVWVYSNITMIYTGNNTWDGGVIATTGSYYEDDVIIPITLPVAKSCLINSVSIKMNLPGDPDQSVAMSIGSVHNPYVAPSDDMYSTVIQPGTAYNNQVSYNHTSTLTPYQSLKIYGNANTNPLTYMTIQIIDTGHNGMSLFNLNLTVSISGTFVSTWSLQDSVNLALGLSIAGNVIVMAYMTDSLDFGGYRKDLPGKRGWSPKRKSGKRR